MDKLSGMELLSSFLFTPFVKKTKIRREQMEKLLCEIEQLVSDYKKNRDIIMQISLLSAGRICYPIMKCYNKLPHIIPTHYRIYFHDLISDQHVSLLSKYGVGIYCVEIERVRSDNNVDSWDMAIMGYTHDNRGERYDCYDVIKIEITKDDKITRVEPASWSHLSKKEFDRILLVSMVAIYEDELVNAVIDNLRYVTKAKSDSIYIVRKLQKLQNEMDLFDILKL